MYNFDYDGSPKITRQRILDESEVAFQEELSQPSLSEDSVNEIFDTAIDSAILGEAILDQLKAKIVNILPVPESQPTVRAAVLRRSDRIPLGSYIDFSLFAESIDSILKAKKFRSNDLVDFTGDPSTDTLNYNIKQRQTLGDSLSTLDLFMAGVVLPGAYIASRLAAYQLIGPLPVLGPLAGEAIAFLFLLGLDRYAVKAEVKRSKINTKINGMDAEDFVDFLADNPKEIHAILRAANIPDSNKLSDYRLIQDYAIKTILSEATSEYDSWLAYYQISYSNHALERIIEMSSRYSSKYAFVANKDFNINDAIKAGARSTEQFTTLGNQYTLRAGLVRNLQPMREAYKQPLLRSVLQASTAYRNIISTLLNDFLPSNLIPDINLSTGNINVGVGVLPPFELTINLNKQILCCLINIFGAFPIDFLKFLARMLRLSVYGVHLNFRQIMANYISGVLNEFTNAALGMIEEVRNELFSQIFSVLNQDNELVDLILACLPAREILMQIFKQFNALTELLRKLILDVRNSVDVSGEAGQFWEIPFPFKRTILFIAELLDAIAIELEYGGGVLCYNSRYLPDQNKQKNPRIDQKIDPDLASQFILNFKTPKVPIVEFDKEFLDRFNAGNYLTIKNKKVVFESLPENSDAALATIMAVCGEELGQEQQEAIRNRIKNIINKIRT